MSKTFVYRLLGIGQLPVERLAELRNEGLAFYDEGIRGTVTYKNFRAPSRYSNWKRQWFSSSIALGRSTFEANGVLRRKGGDLRRRV